VLQQYYGDKSSLKMILFDNYTRKTRNGKGILGNPALRKIFGLNCKCFIHKQNKVNHVYYVYQF
jgi:hypothetical protein